MTVKSALVPLFSAALNSTWLKPSTPGPVSSSWMTSVAVNGTPTLAPPVGSRMSRFTVLSPSTNALSMIGTGKDFTPLSPSTQTSRPCTGVKLLVPAVPPGTVA